MSLRVRAAALATLVVVAAAAGCSSGFFGKKYEYEEDVTLALDGSATIVINASIPALVALRGIDHGVDRSVRVDRNRIRAAYESPVTRVTRVSRPWNRAGRRFIQIRVETDDIRKLSSVAPFSWSKYELTPGQDQTVFHQTVGPSAFKPGTLPNVGWQGSEIVAFRLHLPSQIRHHNSRSLEKDEPLEIQRGNILGWEQHLADRLDGRPIAIHVEMDSRSILYTTLWLFAGSFAAAVALIALLLWLTVRRGAKESTTTPAP
jgi:hypothetical protein